MNRTGSKLVLFLLLWQIMPAVLAQEKRLEVSGVFSMSYSKTKNSGEDLNDIPSNGKFESRTRDLGFGLDLNVGTYILDPRFIKVSFSTGFFRDKGAFDDIKTSYGNTNLGFFLDFLQTSPYPFRFHYTKHNSNYLQKQRSSADARRSSIGFDWALRASRYPKLAVNYDKSTYDTKFLTSSGFKSQVRTWNLSLNDVYKGWEINSNYNNQSTTEGLTNLKTGLSLLRFDARKKVLKNSDLFINSFYQSMDFSTALTRLTQNFTFFNAQASLTTRHTDRLSTRVAYQFYRSVNDQSAIRASGSREAVLLADSKNSAGNRSLQDMPLTRERREFLERQRRQREEMEQAFFEDERRRTLEQGRQVRKAIQEEMETKLTAAAYHAATDSLNAAAVLSPLKVTTSFNSIDGQVTYRLMQEIKVAGSVGARAINPPDRLTENATRFFDVSATVSWNKRIGSIDTRASLTQGLTHAQSNFGESRQVQFHDYSVGLGAGDAKHAHVSADFNATSRPDLFQIGGFVSQKSLSVGVESQALRSFQLRAAAGQSRIAYLTARGREQLRTTTYSASLDHKLFTLLVSRNVNVGVRDIFLIPVPLDRSQIFRILPVDTLIRDPLLNTSGIFTLGLVRVRPTKDIDGEIRYLKDKSFFARASNIFTDQFDLLINYRLGKFIFTGGALFQEQQTEGVFLRDRTYYYFRLSRPFKAL